MKTITILSGKGGVGKSSITASLAVILSKQKKIICADCDVDASNLALVLGVEKYEEWNAISTNQKVEFDLDKCNSCKKCFDSCYFDAIDWVNNKPKLKDFSCEGCGVCSMVCPKNAITGINIKNAQLGYAKTRYGFTVVSAQLGIGQSGSGKVVTEVRKKAINLAEDAEIMLIDSAAGIGCPVIASIAGSDYVILVTEPTPSGFSDMKRAIAMVTHFKIPYGIIINKFDINLEYIPKIESFAKEQDAKILVKLPYDKKFVESLVNLTPIVSYDESKIKIFEEILDNIPLVREGGE
ncbi:MAG: ATP-binding protein [Nanoarchaeota archaeon]|nr:ATP-binding protein [Nanoarchaeota archaeon]